MKNKITLLLDFKLQLGTRMQSQSMKNCMFTIPPLILKPCNMYAGLLYIHKEILLGPRTKKYENTFTYNRKSPTQRFLTYFRRIFSF